MNPNEYLNKVLDSQTLDDDSEELKLIRERRTHVEELLNKSFNQNALTVRYGGSKAKGTLIKENYDLDLIAYFAADDDSGGETLKDIYENVQNVLATEYTVNPKTSAIRLYGKGDLLKQDFHIDVVPGRFTDKSATDAFLYQSGSTDKARLKTNLDKHISFIKDSGQVDAIKLLKLWKIRKALEVKTFVLELMIIKILNTSKNRNIGLDKKLLTFWQELKDSNGDIPVEDPANPEGNDLSGLINMPSKSYLSMCADASLQAVETEGWNSIFGEMQNYDRSQVISTLIKVGPERTDRAKPWSENL